MNNDILIEFVDRIESRGGLASREEIFIEMLDLYDQFLKAFAYDGLNLYKQLESIYRDLKKESDSIKKFRELYILNPFDKCERCKDRPIRPIKKGKYCLFCENQINSIVTKENINKRKLDGPRPVFKSIYCNKCGQEKALNKTGCAKCYKCLNEYKRQWYKKTKGKNKDGLLQKPQI